jgi:hypothetical protein
LVQLLRSVVVRLAAAASVSKSLIFTAGAILLKLGVMTLAMT